MRKAGVLTGGALAVFLALVHTVNDAITAILGALLPTLQERFDVGRRPHGRRPLRALFDRQLVRGPVGALAVAGSFTSIAFVTFTSTLPLWLVRDHGYETDAPMIGWTLGLFALAAGGGALLGGVLAPRLGRLPTVVGSLLLALVPLLLVVIALPGGALSSRRSRRPAP